MSDISAIMFICDSPQLLVSVMNQVGGVLPPEVRKRLIAAYCAFSNLNGLEAAWRRMNGRSIQAILDDYEASEKPVPICSGELNGVKYRLYDVPKANSNDAP